MSDFVMTRVARVIDEPDPIYTHSFGGKQGHKGVFLPGSSVPLHLLYTFDTTDPAFPLTIPHVRLLPLYYCFPYDAGALGYLVKSDSEIEILYMETMEPLLDFPFKGYPAIFPERAVRLVPISYEEQKTLVFFLQAGKDALSEADRKLLDSFSYPFTQLGGIQSMCQGVPEVRCPNPRCEYHEFTCFLDVFAVVWNQPHAGVQLWDDHSKEDIQVIFQICPKCHAIHACNRCD